MILVTLVTALAIAAPCAPVDVHASAAHIRALVLAGSAADALTEADQDEASLPCLTDLPTPSDLGLLFQAGGAAAIAAGKPARAAELLGTAARIAGAIPFDPALGAEAASTYASLRAAQANGPHVTATSAVLVALDGWNLAAGEERFVAPGLHLVQYPARDGLVTEWRVIDADGRVGPEVREAKARSPIGLTVLGYGLCAVGAAGIVASKVESDRLLADETQAQENGVPLTADALHARSSQINGLDVGGGVSAIAGVAVLGLSHYVAGLSLSVAW